jgi:hypothetical protein
VHNGDVSDVSVTYPTVLRSFFRQRFHGDLAYFKVITVVVYLSPAKHADVALIPSLCSPPSSPFSLCETYSPEWTNYLSPLIPFFTAARLSESGYITNPYSFYPGDKVEAGSILSFPSIFPHRGMIFVFFSFYYIYIFFFIYIHTHIFLY